MRVAEIADQARRLVVGLFGTVIEGHPALRITRSQTGEPMGRQPHVATNEHAFDSGVRPPCAAARLPCPAVALPWSTVARSPRIRIHPAAALAAPQRVARPACRPITRALGRDPCGELRPHDVHRRLAVDRRRLNARRIDLAAIASSACASSASGSAVSSRVTRRNSPVADPLIRSMAPPLPHALPVVAIGWQTDPHVPQGDEQRSVRLCQVRLHGRRCGGHARRAGQPAIGAKHRGRQHARIRSGRRVHVHHGAVDGRRAIRDQRDAARPWGSTVTT